MSLTAQLALVHPAIDFEGLLPPPDRRIHERLTLSSLAWLNEVRLKYGPAVSLIDLSAGGAQFEISGHRLEPGRTVVIELAGGDLDCSIPSRIVRCGVTGIRPEITYRGAVEFKRPIELPTRSMAYVDAEVSPLLEHARLAAALKRAAGASTALTAGDDGLTAAGSAALVAARDIIESAGRCTTAPYAREMSRLMRAMTRSVEKGTPSDAVILEIAEQLRRTVPARSIRLASDGTSALMPRPDTLRFDVPSPAGKAKQLLVEFAQDSRVEDWQLELLESAAHLITAHQNAAPVPQPKAPPPPRAASPQEHYGWHRLVVRYRDGRMMKGFGRDFHPSKGHLQVWLKMDSPDESRLNVRLSHLKAVFFVHDFEGGPRSESPDENAAAAGRRIIVTFLDGEVLDATTLNYAPGAPGFFVEPIDTTTNNQRIFVVNEAVRHVQFP